MKVFLDTNVLVSAVVRQHVFHERSFTVLDCVQAGKHKGFVSAHSLAEIYSVLTSLPSPYRHTPEQASLSIEVNVLGFFRTVELLETDYASLIRDAAKSQIKGGTIYDALLLKAAAKASVDRIYTWNLKHFLSIAPADLRRKISEP